MSGRLGVSFVVFVCILLSIGCSGKDEQMRLSKINTLIVNTVPDSYNLVIASSQGMHDVNGFFEAEVEVENPTSNRYDDIEYRFKWYDRHKREVGQDLSMWQPLIVEAKDKTVIHSLAPLSEAQRYRCYIRARQR